MLNDAKKWPWKFLVFQNVLPFVDVFTDFISGLNYYKEGHRLWASCIWALMWGPLLLSTSSDLINLLRRCIGKKRHEFPRQGVNLEMNSLNHDAEKSIPEEPEQTWFQKYEMNIWKFAAQIPFLQPVVHAIFTYKLYKAESGMDKALADYKKYKSRHFDDIKYSTGIKVTKNEVVTVAREYVKLKKEKSSILTTFQGIRIFELIGESGPQALLQLSIALRIGYIDWIQVRVEKSVLFIDQGSQM